MKRIGVFNLFPFLCLVGLQVLVQAQDQVDVLQDEVEVQVEEHLNDTLVEEFTDDNIEEEVESTLVEGTSYVVRPVNTCFAEATYCIPVSTFSHLPQFNQDPSTLNEVEKDDLKEAYVVYMKRIKMYVDDLTLVIAEALVDQYEKVKNSRTLMVTVEGPGVNVSMYSLGLEISDLGQIDYLKGQFVIDVRIYVHKVPVGGPHQDLKSAISASWTAVNETTVTAPDRQEDEGHIRLLPDEYLFVQDDVDSEEILLTDGRCNDDAFDSMLPLTEEEFNAISGGIHIARLSDPRVKLSPIFDGNGNLVFVEGRGIPLKFQPRNRHFYPFQVNLLDVKIISYPTGIYAQQGSELVTFCINPAFTGFNDPIPSLPDRGKLTLIPHIEVLKAVPWFNEGNAQMQLEDTGFSVAHEDISERAFQAGSFRVVYRNRKGFGWMILLPFLFTAFTTQLQWLVTTPENCSASSMITSVLLIQNIVGAQRPYVGHQTIVSKVIYLTYGVAGIYVTAVALMTFINITKTTGKIDWIASRQKTIFQYLQLIGLLLTPLYIPLIVFKTDATTGEQDHIAWLWPLVGTLCVVIFLTKILLDVLRWKRNKAKEDATQKEPVDYERIDLQTKAITTLTVEEVRQWMSTSQELEDASPFDKEELSAIAHKFQEAKIDGNALLRTAADPKLMVQYVGLTVGEAINICDAFEKLKRGQSIRLEEGEHPTVPSNVEKPLGLDPEDL